jgi:hypothetical protein
MKRWAAFQVFGDWRRTSGHDSPLRDFDRLR